MERPLVVETGPYRWSSSSSVGHVTAGSAWVGCCAGEAGGGEYAEVVEVVVAMEAVSQAESSSVVHGE